MTDQPNVARVAALAVQSAWRDLHATTNDLIGILSAANDLDALASVDLLRRSLDDLAHWPDGKLSNVLEMWELDL